MSSIRPQSYTTRIGAVLLALFLACPLSAQEVPRTVGDVTRDGVISAVDALAVLVHIVGNPVPAHFEVDPDGDAACRSNVAGRHPQTGLLKHDLTVPTITAVDALFILSHVVGKVLVDGCLGYENDPDLWARYTSEFFTRDIVTVEGINRWGGVIVDFLEGSGSGSPWNSYEETPEHALAGLLRFTSDDPEVARVDTISEWPAWALVQIRGVTPGVTKVYAHWFDRTDTATVTVHPWEPTGITVIMSQLTQIDGGVRRDTLVVGDTTSAYAHASDDLGFSKVLGGDTLTWVSRDPSVLFVGPEGKLTAAGDGTTWLVASWDAFADSVEVTVITDAQAIVATVGGSYRTWFAGNYGFSTGGLALSNAAFQHNAPWANAGMEKYGRLPRIAFLNSQSDSDYNYMVRPWTVSYNVLRAIGAVIEGLDTSEAQAELTASEIDAAKAFIRFVQGMAHAQVAVLYAEGFVLDETTDTTPPMTPVPYGHLMDAAMGYFDQAIALSESGAFTLPEAWMRAALTGPELARAAHSMKARYRAAGARTFAERQSLDWTQILADVDAGITSDLMVYMDNDGGWSNDVLRYGTFTGWSQMGYFIYGMADQSGDFQAWNALPLIDKHPNDAGGEPVLIVTPDLRFAQGATVEEQRANPGTYFRIQGADEGVWFRPDRGTWRWSWYKHGRGEEYWNQTQYLQPEIRLEEMRLLKAEGLFHTGALGPAATIINETREAAGLNATDADGANTSCVPKLPDGSCGGLFEMLKWEKRMENTFKGPLGNLWYFDGRGWGDLWEGTFLHLPIPCGVAQRHLLPCTTFGGPGGAGAAPRSNYNWTGEGG